MGQSASTSNSSNRILTPAIVSSSSQSPELPDEATADVDYTEDIPDECLAYIFQFLSTGDRKSCSLRFRNGKYGDFAYSENPECSNLGLVCVAENCKQLRKLHIDGWRTNRIGDEGLIAVAKHCPNLQELVLIGVDATQASLAAIAANCQKLERLALCGTGSIGDQEIACIAAKCVALKKLCIKGCAISDVAIRALAWGCPNLVKIKLKQCRGVSSEVVECLQRQKASLVVNFDAAGSDNEGLDASMSDGVGQESGLEFPEMSGQMWLQMVHRIVMGDWLCLERSLGSLQLGI
ncbi:hypothetical protein GH714_014970 [Hevea brasiliensis]|uniref:F-box/LRR-repeat protein 15/At3g58940/PEG3-like LRR domain-containing protein n=1 Tax=Hevea brasiliensis TaxID=3981 RepID=A0A6A6K688_HEVBR|nr:hypothetical protein GH714_014970 [Hevea brasiliensis]